MKTETLFSLKGNFQVVRLSESDAKSHTDHLMKFRETVLENAHMYPNIDNWFDRKVIPGLKNSERIAYLGYLDGKPAVSAVIKRGEAAKFCHLRIKEELQGIHLGEVFFALMGFEVKDFAKEVHFTLPESVWQKEREFFKSFGFVEAVKAGHQYRLFEDELRCSSPFYKVWNAVLEKLPKIVRLFNIDGQSLDTRLLMSVRAEHARKVLAGKKKVEIRRKFSKKWTGCRVSIYASGHERCLAGEASIGSVIVGEPESIWERFHKELGCTKAEFDEYTMSAREIYAVVLENATPYRKSISLGEVCNFARKRLRPPQSYCDLSRNTTWAEAVSVSSLLQRSFTPPEKILL